VSDESSDKKPIPPYVGFGTFTNFLDGLQQGVPSHIDKSLMSSLSGSSQSQLLSALRYLSLIDEQGCVDDRLDRLVHSQFPEKREHYSLLAKASYPFLFNEFDLSITTPKQFEQKLLDNGATSATVSRCTAFFISFAKIANIQISPHLEQSTKSRKNTNGKARGRKSRGVNLEKESDALPLPLVVEQEQPTWEQQIRLRELELKGMVLKDKIPEFDPAWEPDVLQAWLQTVRQLSKGSFDVFEIDDAEK
jgi:hypothetical protein